MGCKFSLGLLSFRVWGGCARGVRVGSGGCFGAMCPCSVGRVGVSGGDSWFWVFGTKVRRGGGGGQLVFFRAYALALPSLLSVGKPSVVMVRVQGAPGSDESHL